METTYSIITVDGSETIHTVELADKPDYYALKAIIEPILKADMEHVTVLHGNQRVDMFVDEDGIGKGLEYNSKATAIYRANWIKHHPKDDPDTMPHIAGTAVLFGRQVWF